MAISAFNFHISSGVYFLYYSLQYEQWLQVCWTSSSWNSTTAAVCNIAIVYFALAESSWKWCIGKYEGIKSSAIAEIKTKAWKIYARNQLNNITSSNEMDFLCISMLFRVEFHHSNWLFNYLLIKWWYYRVSIQPSRAGATNWWLNWMSWIHLFRMEPLHRPTEQRDCDLTSAWRVQLHQVNRGHSRSRWIAHFTGRTEQNYDVFFPPSFHRSWTSLMGFCCPYWPMTKKNRGRCWSRDNTFQPHILFSIGNNVICTHHIWTTTKKYVFTSEEIMRNTSSHSNNKDSFDNKKT